MTDFVSMVRKLDLRPPSFRSLISMAERVSSSIDRAIFCRLRRYHTSVGKMGSVLVLVGRGHS